MRFYLNTEQQKYVYVDKAVIFISWRFFWKNAQTLYVCFVLHGIEVEFMGIL